MADYTSSGAGTASANQHYTANGTKGGKTAYQGDTTDTIWIAYNTALAGWTIGGNPDSGLPVSGPHMYTHDDDTAAPPLTGWATGGSGSAPAPTLTEDAAAQTIACTGVGR